GGEGSRGKFLAAIETGADVTRPNVLSRPFLRVLNRPSVGIDALGPIDVNEGVGGNQLSIPAIEHIEEAVPVSGHQRLYVVAADRKVGQHLLVDAVIVPRIVRGLLVRPNDLAGISVERERRG